MPPEVNISVPPASDYITVQAPEPCACSVDQALSRAVNLIGATTPEDDGSKCFVKVRATEAGSNRFSFTYAMADTGNRACTLLSEDEFKRIYTNHQLHKVPRHQGLNGAGAGHKLEVLGMPTRPCHMFFYSPEPDEPRQIMYNVKPVVVRGLNMECLLSYRDLKAIDAKVNCKEDYLEIHRNRCEPLRIPLRGRKMTNVPVVNNLGFDIKPNEEAVLSVQVPDAQIGTEVLIEPIEENLSHLGLIMCASVDKVRPEKRVRIRVYNPSNHIVSIPENTCLGQANPFGDQPTDDVVACIAANVAKTLLETGTGAAEMSKVTNPKTKKELFDRLWKDLQFDRTDLVFTHEQKVRITNAFVRRRNALALVAEDVGLVKGGVEFEINTGNHPPIREKDRPIPPSILEDLKIQIKRWMTQGVAEPGHGPWAAALVPVRKKNGGWRFAVDYRRLNAITVKDARPVANLNDKLAQLKGEAGKPLKYWASMDLSEAYHSVPVKEEDKDKTAVITPLGLFRFNRMTFGFCNAPQTFHQVVQLLEKGMFEKNPILAKTILLYFDDAILGGHDFDALLAKIELFLECVEELGLRIQPRKCSIGTNELKWLGHTISSEGIKPDPDLVRTMKEWDSPMNSEQLGALNGALGYFRKFNRNHAMKTYEISELIKKTGKYKKGKPVKLGEPWSFKHEKEKNAIIEHLLKPPILMHPDLTPEAKPFIVSVDTSSRGVGMSLSQVQSIRNPVTSQMEDREVFIAFGSKKLNEAQSKWSSYRMEMYGLVLAVQKFDYYLKDGGFIIRTDNKALESLMKSKSSKLPNQCFRWQQTLCDYQPFEIVYVPASKMKLADALSRKGYKDGDTGTLNEFVPYRDIRWDDELEFINEARIRDDDEFWLPYWRVKHTDQPITKPPTVSYVDVAAVTRSRTRLSNKTTTPTSSNQNAPAMHEDAHSSPAGQRAPTTSHFSPIPGPLHDEEAAQPTVDDEEGDEKSEVMDTPPQASFLTPEETWDQLVEGLPTPADDPELEIDIPTPPTAWWLYDLLKAQQQLDKVISTIIEYVDTSTLEPHEENLRQWPKGASQIRRRVEEVFGPSLIGKASNANEEKIAEDQIRLTKMFNASKNGKKDYIVKQDGVLWLKRTIQGIERTLLVIPKSMVINMIQTIHHANGSFHLGIDRTLAAAEMYFWAPELKEAVTTYVNTCRTCQDGKRLPNRQGPGLGQTASRPHERLRKFAVDCVQMPKGKNNYNYLFTLLDISTGWMEAWPMKQATSHAICKILENDFFPRFAEGHTFIADQGREFIAHKLKKLVKRYHGRIHYGTSHHPNSNPIERHHRTLVSLIRCLLIDAGLAKENWPETLPRALYTMRCAPSALTKDSPFNRVYGFFPFTQSSSWLNQDPNDEMVYQNLGLAQQRDQTYPEGPYPSPQADNTQDNEVIAEDDDSVTVRNGEQRRTLTKLRGQNQTFLAEVNVIDESNIYHEYHQAKKDKTSYARHLFNKAKFDSKQQPKPYRPCLWELVDWKSPIDPESTHSRKLANVWRGPFVVSKVRHHPYNVNIQELNLATMEPDVNSTRDVYCGDLRPTLQLAFRNRPRQQWAPEWVPRVE